MNSMPETDVSSLTEADDIPTLENPINSNDHHDLKLETMVSHLAEDLQATLQQQVYASLVKTMHKVLHEEGQRLTGKILEKLQEQLPDIIEAACQKNTK